MKILLLLIVLLLVGCETAKPKPEIIRVEVTVPVPCIKPDTVPEKPIRRTGVGAWPGDVAAVQAIIADLEAAEQYGVQWEAAAAGCVSTPSNTKPE